MKTLNIILSLSLWSSIAFAQAEAPGKAITPAKPKQTQGKTFGESMAGGLATSQPSGTTPATITNNPLYQGDSHTRINPLHKSEAKKASPGNPIGGIIVKGGRKEL